LIRAATESPDAPCEADGGQRVPLDPSLVGVPAKAVHVTTGVATYGGGRLHIPIAWHAQPGQHAFPTFEGRLGLEPAPSWSRRCWTLRGEADRQGERAGEASQLRAPGRLPG
jgi:hypothetical protein